MYEHHDSKYGQLPFLMAVNGRGCILAAVMGTRWIEHTVYSGLIVWRIDVDRWYISKTHARVMFVRWKKSYWERWLRLCYYKQTTRATFPRFVIKRREFNQCTEDNITWKRWLGGKLIQKRSSSCNGGQRQRGVCLWRDNTAFSTLTEWKLI